AGRFAPFGCGTRGGAPGSGDEGRPDAQAEPAPRRSAATNPAASREISATGLPGLNSAEPMPNPDAPAAREAARLSGVTPPTGMSCGYGGSTARIASTNAGGRTSPGNSFSASAPAASAANASPGVATPGAEIRPASTVAPMTAGSL